MICPKCYGVGRIPFGEEPEIYTNEEWLRICNTEQLARWIAEEKLCRGYFIFPSMEEAIQDALEWLKQPHSEVGK